MQATCEPWKDVGRGLGVLPEPRSLAHTQRNTGDVHAGPLLGTQWAAAGRNDCDPVPPSFTLPEHPRFVHRYVVHLEMLGEDRQESLQSSPFATPAETVHDDPLAEKPDLEASKSDSVAVAEVPVAGPPTFPEGGLQAWLSVLGGCVSVYHTKLKAI